MKELEDTVNPIERITMSSSFIDGDFNFYR